MHTHSQYNRTTQALVWLDSSSTCISRPSGSFLYWPYSRYMCKRVLTALLSGSCSLSKSTKNSFVTWSSFINWCLQKSTQWDLSSTWHDMFSSGGSCSYHNQCLLWTAPIPACDTSACHAGVTVQMFRRCCVVTCARNRRYAQVQANVHDISTYHRLARVELLVKSCKSCKSYDETATHVNQSTVCNIAERNRPRGCRSDKTTVGIPSTWELSCGDSALTKLPTETLIKLLRTITLWYCFDKTGPGSYQ